jgi:hypothetical protein
MVECQPGASFVEPGLAWSTSQAHDAGDPLGTRAVLLESSEACPCRTYSRRGRGYSH